MATFRKTGGRWRAEIAKNGIRKSKTLSKKRDAQAWAAEVEAAIANGEYRMGAAPSNAVFADGMARYAEVVSPRKRGAPWEKVRLNALARCPEFSEIPLDEFCPRHFAMWKERRLNEVSSSTVAREMTLLKDVAKTMLKEWEWVDKDLVEGVSRPKEKAPRTRTATSEEITAYLDEAGFAVGQAPNTVKARVGAAFLFSCETAMRGGEICALTEEDIDWGQRLALIRTSKNDESRLIPLSTRAVEILETMLLNTAGQEHIFGLNSAQRDANSRKIIRAAGIEDFCFHDARRTSLTNLAEKLSPMELAKISGHKDLKILLEVYYQPSIAELVSKLD